MKKTVSTILGFTVLIGISILIVLHCYLLDGLDGWFFSRDSVEDTVFAPGYSDKGFRQVKSGMSKQEVVKLLGMPLREGWKYEVPENIWIRFESSRVDHVTNGSTDVFSKIREGMKKEEVLNILGAPEKESLIYSKSPGDRSYRIRIIILKDDRVTEKIHEFYVD